MLALTADDTLARHVLSVAATVGVDVQLTVDPAQTRPAWGAAALVLVGADQAAAVAELKLPRRSEVYVLGAAAEAEQAQSWSARLGAMVLTLPDAAGDLAEVMARRGAGAGPSHATMCVVGGAGGVGASTLATGLAVTSARSGAVTLLVDGDHLGGGIDLLLGAEHVTGWRWSRLAAVRGYLGDLGEQLPGVEGVDLLAMDRWPVSAGVLHPDQVSAVAAWATRRYDLAVWDVPRSLGPAAAEVLRRADQTLLIVQADVRGVAAAATLVPRLQPACGGLGLVVRLSRTRGLDASAVVDALALPLLATVQDEPSLVGGAERGDPPGRSPRSPLARTCRQLLIPVSAGRRAA